MLSLVCAESALSAMQNIQELTPDSAKKHGLTLRQWPLLSGAATPGLAQQIGSLSLSGSGNGCTEESQAAPYTRQNGTPASLGKLSQAESIPNQSPAEPDQEQRSSDGGNGSSSSKHGALSLPRPDTGVAQDTPALSSTSSETKARIPGGTASMPAAEAASCDSQEACTGRDTESRGVSSSTVSEQLVLSKETSVPGHPWLPCPRLATPDAAESDFLTVSTSSSLPTHLQALTGRVVLGASVLGTLWRFFQEKRRPKPVLKHQPTRAQQNLPHLGLYSIVTASICRWTTC